MTQPPEPRVNCDAASAQHLVLGPDCTYMAVAREFSVGARMVRKKANELRWRERVEAIQAERGPGV